MTDGLKANVNHADSAAARLQMVFQHLNGAKASTATASQQVFHSDTVAVQPPSALGVTPPGAWHPPSPAELKSALGKADGLFAKHLNNPESEKWLNELAHCLEHKSASMKPEDKGFEFYMRFKATYGPVHHIGSASVWRAESGELRAAVMHQESLPPTKENPIPVGQVFNTFDTSKTLHRTAPVDLSMAFVGPPDVNVYPVPHPQFMESVTDFLSDPDAAHPYGLFESYGPKMKDDPEKRHLNCFAIVDLGHRALTQGELSLTNEPVLPDICERSSDMVCTNFRGRFNEIAIGGKKYEIDKVASYENKVGVQMATHVGLHWGNDKPWDVPSPRGVSATPTTVQPQAGETLQLPKNTLAIKFVSRPAERFLDGARVDSRKSYTPEEKARFELRGLFLDGKPVNQAQPYTAEQAARMQYKGAEPMKISFLHSFAQQPIAARL